MYGFHFPPLSPLQVSLVPLSPLTDTGCTQVRGRRLSISWVWVLLAISPGPTGSLLGHLNATCNPLILASSLPVGLCPQSHSQRASRRFPLRPPRPCGDMTQQSYLTPLYFRPSVFAGMLFPSLPAKIQAFMAISHPPFPLQLICPTSNRGNCFPFDSRNTLIIS